MNFLKKITFLGILCINLSFASKTTKASDLHIDNFPPPILRHIESFAKIGKELRLVSKNFAHSISAGDILTLPKGFGSQDIDLEKDIPHPYGLKFLDLTNLNENDLRALGLLDKNTPLCKSLIKFLSKKEHTVECVAIWPKTILRDDLGLKILELKDLPGQTHLPLTLRQKALMGKLFSVEMRHGGYSWKIGEIPQENKFVQFAQAIELFLKRHPLCIAPLTNIQRGIAEVGLFASLLMNNDPNVLFLEAIASLDPAGFSDVVTGLQFPPAKSTPWKDLCKFSPDQNIKILNLLKIFFPPYVKKDLVEGREISFYWREALRHPHIYPGFGDYKRYDGNPAITYIIEGVEKTSRVARIGLFEVFIKGISKVAPSKQYNFLKRVTSVLKPYHLVEIHPLRAEEDYVREHGYITFRGIMFPFFKAMERSLDELDEDEFGKWHEIFKINNTNPLNKYLRFDFTPFKKENYDKKILNFVPSPYTTEINHDSWEYQGNFRRQYYSCGDYNRWFICLNKNDEDSFIREIRLHGYWQGDEKVGFSLKGRYCKEELNNLGPFSEKISSLASKFSGTCEYISGYSTGPMLLKFLYTLKQIPDFVLDRLLKEAGWEDFRFSL